MDTTAREACDCATHTASVTTHHLWTLLGAGRTPRPFSCRRAELPPCSLSANSTRSRVSPSATQRSELRVRAPAFSPGGYIQPVNYYALLSLVPTCSFQPSDTAQANDRISLTGHHIHRRGTQQALNSTLYQWQVQVVTIRPKAGYLLSPTFKAASIVKMQSNEKAHFPAANPMRSSQFSFMLQLLFFKEHSLQLF